MHYQGVVFDLDGTLVDTLEDLADAVNIVLARRGYRRHPVESIRSFVGNGSWNLIRRSLPDGEDEETVRHCLMEFKQEYATGWANKTRPYPGVVELIEELANIKVPAAVVTNKDEEFAKKVVAHFFPRGGLKIVIGNRPGLPLKPCPAGALEAASRLCLKPDTLVYVGDSGVDMQTAAGAGMYAVGVLWGFRPEEELKRNRARLLISRPQELLSLLS
ncbi:MAG: HAD family hydrolase [Desulfovibrionales bacterium]